MAASKEVHKCAYKYNVVPEIKREYFGEEFWTLIRNAEARKADYDWHGNEIVICSHPRSGTHMTWNIVRYLLQGNTNKPSDTMTSNSYPPYFRLEGSPQTGPRRVLYSHQLPCQFASDSLLKTGNRKFIYLIRNPNDCAVSSFHLYIDMVGAILPKQFPDFYNEFITGTIQSCQLLAHPKLAGGETLYYRFAKDLSPQTTVSAQQNRPTTYPCMGWYNHVKGWEEYAAKNPDVPIMFQMFEDLVRNPKESIAKIAKFLDMELTEEFHDELVEASKFTVMRKRPEDVDVGTDNAFHGDANAALYRKGEIGQWRDRMTVANYELFQKVFPELSSDMVCKDKLTFT